ncbi:MAG: amidase [Acidobacteria bacterium]|nr:amidase [Acidobacteriota bacterium]
MNIREAGAALRAKQVSSVELTTECLRQIDRHNARVNAFLTVTAEAALEAACQADAELAAGTGRGPLHGIPIAHKDLFDTAGVRTTYGSRIFADHVPTQDADVVAILKQAGAVSLGKLGLHEFAYGITSSNPHFGPVRNPWDVERIPGGSSGGSGVATAMGMCFMATGTDTGGSIRIPASFCGVSGLKPTFGKLSTAGCRALSESLDHMGPLARTVGDVAASYDALTGKASSLELPKGLRLGIPQNFFFDHSLPEVTAAVHRAAQFSGCEIVPVTIDAGEELVDLALKIIFAEAADQMVDLWDRRDEFGADVRARFEQGHAQDPQLYLRAQRHRVAAERRFLKVFEHCDVLLTPASPTPAPKIGDNVLSLNGVEYDLRLATTRLARPINLLGIPALSLPGGLTSDKLPIGLQLLGRHHEEEALLQVGAQMEQGIGPLKPVWE